MTKLTVPSRYYDAIQLGGGGWRLVDREGGGGGGVVNMARKEERAGWRGRVAVETKRGVMWVQELAAGHRAAVEVAT